MAVLPLIEDPEAYRPDTVDMDDPRARKYWLDLFDRNTAITCRRAAASDGDTADARTRADALAREFDLFLAGIREKSSAKEGNSILAIAQVRQGLLTKYGFADPFKTVKQQETEASLPMLPGLLAELDSLDGERRLLAQIECAFAGNIFDLGCQGPAALYEAGQLEFRKVRSTLPCRPWLVDDFDALTARFARGGHRKAVLFLDNAGADVVLGMLPLAHYLLQRGTNVVLAANSRPALNDMTFDEVESLLARAAEAVPAIRQVRADGRLSVIASGSGAPMINLAEISDALAEASRDADLLVIEGMGRALETNYHTRFTCDTLKLAMIKDQYIAELFVGRLYDVVCRFEPRAG